MSTERAFKITSNSSYLNESKRICHHFDTIWNSCYNLYHKKVGKWYGAWCFYATSEKLHCQDPIAMLHILIIRKWVFGFG